MDTKQLNDTLDKLFSEKSHHIVFWNDPEQEFLSFINELPLFFIEGVQVIRLDQTAALAAKLQKSRRLCLIYETDFEIQGAISFIFEGILRI